MNKEKSVLDGMKMISSPQNVDSVGKIKDGLAYYQTKMSEVNTSILKTKKSLEQNQKQLREKRNQLEVILQNDNAEINSNGKEYYIKLSVYAKQPVNSAVITYNYMISGVQWQTLYDINLSSNGDVAEFELKTQISQYSGEDWTDVNLTFSTDSPERDITDFTSEIQSEYVNYYGEVIKTSKKQKTQQGKGTLLGRVVDAQTDEPLPFVNVVFKRNNVTLGGEATDIDGYFTAKDISAGDVTIEASYMGYDKVQKNISVSPNIFTNCGAIAMKPHVQALNEVMLVERSVPLLEDGHYEAGKKITSDDIDRIDGDNDLGNFVNGTSRKGSVYIPKTPMQPTTTEMPVDITKIESLGKEYKTDMSYTVKSDDKAKIIPLESATSREKYKYLAIPKSNDRVFLCAYIPSWEKLGFMNSQANIYMDDKYIGRTEINTDNVKDTLTLKVNSEKRIAVERKQEVSAPEKAGSFSSQVVEKYTVTIAVKNNMLKDIDVDLKDLVPVSKYTEVTVTPVALNGGKHNKIREKSPGICI
ncbi:MAG: DUF4139 domain-containing protein [Bacteroidales bacterium]|nr:DUF4139 domain-containing protein [Bacteroidales bacterium]